MTLAMNSFTRIGFIIWFLIVELFILFEQQAPTTPREISNEVKQ